MWGAIRYGKLSELIILPELLIDVEGKKDKFDAEKYRDLVMEGEMYNFWTEAYEDCEQFLMMKDGAPYHKGVAGKLREQWEEMGYQG